MYLDSECPISEEEYERKYYWLMKNGFKLVFVHQTDIKFRFQTDKWYFFHTIVHLIEELLDKNENLKERIYGESNSDFKFDENFLEAKSKFYMHYSRQISRTEKNANLEFDSIWTLVTNIFKFSFGKDDDKCLPLRSADQM